MPENPWKDRHLEDPDEHLPMTEEQPEETMKEEELDIDEVPVSADVEALQAKLEAARAQVLSAHAEMENVRRRTNDELVKVRKFAVEKLVNELIPILDSLDQALQNAPGNDPMAEGVQLTAKMFVDVLGRFGVKILNPLGEKFDPQLHEAMAMQPSPDHDPNVVLNVLQKGYTLNDRLVRPARVIVSK